MRARTCGHSGTAPPAPRPRRAPPAAGSAGRRRSSIG